MSGKENGDTLLDIAARKYDPRHQFLTAGKTYRVIKEFSDYDRNVHAVGEQWMFLGSSFVPYHDGLSWFVTFDGRQERQIRMQWIPEEQGPVIDALRQYIEEV